MNFGEPPVEALIREVAEEMCICSREIHVRDAASGTWLLVSSFAANCDCSLGAFSRPSVKLRYKLRSARDDCSELAAFHAHATEDLE